MDTRFLQSLLEVVRLGSIAEAARSLNLTSAAVGQRIKTLERDLNADLLTRTGHKAVPTEACLHFLPRIQEIVRECQDLEFGWDPTGLSGVLRVGAITTALTGFIPTAIKDVRQNYPQMQIHLYPGSSKDLYRQVMDGDLDLAIIVCPPTAVDNSLISEIIYYERLVFVSSDTVDTDPDRALLSEPYIAYDPTSWGGLAVQRYLDRRGLKPDTISVLDSPETIVTLVEDGLGVSILPDWNGLKAQKRNIRLASLQDLSEQRVISTIQRHGSPRTTKIDLFNRILKELVDAREKEN